MSGITFITIFQPCHRGHSVVVAIGSTKLPLLDEKQAVFVLLQSQTHWMLIWMTMRL